MASRKEHVDEAGFCKHCMATVDGDGYAVAEQEQLTPYEGKETEQQASTEAMRENSGASFAKAVKNYADGGVVEDVDQGEWIDMGTHKILREDMAPEDWAKADELSKSAPERRKRAAFEAAPPEMKAAIIADHTNPEKVAQERELREKKKARYASAFGGGGR